MISDETSEVSSFRFLFSSSAPSRAVLEFDTAVNPVRIFLSQEQLDRLGTEAKIASDELAEPVRASARVAFDRVSVTSYLLTN